MEKLQITRFPKAKDALALSHHVGNSKHLKELEMIRPSTVFAMYVNLEMKLIIADLNMHYKGPGSPFSRL